MMRTIRALAVIAVGLVFAVGMASTVEAQKVPAPMTFEQGKDSPGAVTFSHDSHKEAAEKCSGCHPKAFKMKKGTSGNLTMAKMNAGESCGTCHNGKTEIKGKKVFSTQDKGQCASCHKKA